MGLLNGCCGHMKENMLNILPVESDDDESDDDDDFDEAMMLMEKEEKWLLKWLTGAVGIVLAVAAVANLCYV